MNGSQNSKKKSIDTALAALRGGKFVLVRKKRVRIWHSWLLVGVLIGVIIAVIIIVSRTGGTS